ncbi:hypothetical protein [Streptomyces sp. NPDC056160]|uniref:hypothetical protein n=1 Tax=Streptomyces sp. NPDC056160 TaxID=3345731 RepID=UPI0035DA64F1
MTNLPTEHEATEHEETPSRVTLLDPRRGMGTCHGLGNGRFSRPPVQSGGGFLGELADAAKMRAVREADLNRVLERLDHAGTQIRVGRYALVGHSGDPAVRLLQTQTVINRMGWESPLATYDSTGMSDPLLRPELASLLGRIRRGEIHGIVAASPTDITTFRRSYLGFLDAVRACGGFLALLRDETAL